MASEERGEAIKGTYLRLPHTLDRYRFRTTWLLAAPLPEVWSAILDSRRWSEWWPGVLQVTQVRPGDANGIDDVRHYVWRSRLPYRLEFDVRVVRLEPLSRIEGLASGEVVGVGVWRFVAGQEGTRVEYVWDVRTTPVWMRILSPIARPLIRWNHHAIMQAGGEALARHLSAQLLRNESETLD